MIADFLALSFEQMLHHCRAVAVADGLRLDTVEYAHFAQYPLDLQPARGAIEDHGVGVEHRVLERADARYVRRRRAVADHHPDADAPEGHAFLPGDFFLPDEAVDCLARRDHDVGLFPAGDAPLDHRRRRPRDPDVAATLHAEQFDRVEQPGLDRPRAQYMNFVAHDAKILVQVGRSRTERSVSTFCNCSNSALASATAWVFAVHSTNFVHSSSGLIGS